MSVDAARARRSSPGCGRSSRPIRPDAPSRSGTNRAGAPAPTATTRRSDAFWTALYLAGAELVLNGHDHDYERFAPQDPSGRCDLVRGSASSSSGRVGRSFGALRRERGRTSRPPMTRPTASSSSRCAPTATTGSSCPSRARRSPTAAAAPATAPCPSCRHRRPRARHRRPRARHRRPRARHRRPRARHRRSPGRRRVPPVRRSARVRRTDGTAPRSIPYGGRLGGPGGAGSSRSR